MWAAIFFDICMNAFYLSNFSSLGKEGFILGQYLTKAFWWTHILFPSAIFIGKDPWIFLKTVLKTKDRIVPSYNNGMSY